MAENPEQTASAEKKYFVDKKTDMILKRLVFAVLSLIAVSIWIIVIDAFLIKNKTGFTITGLLYAGLKIAEKLTFNVGYYFGKILNVLQFVWDIVDNIWETILPYLPIEEAIIAKNNFNDLFESITKFVLGGFIGDVTRGFVEAFKANMIISTGMSFILIFVGLSYINNTLNNADKKLAVVRNEN